MWTPDKQTELEDWQGASQAYRDAYYCLRDLGLTEGDDFIEGGVVKQIHLDFLYRSWKNSQLRAEWLVLEKIHGP